MQVACITTWSKAKTDTWNGQPTTINICVNAPPEVHKDILAAITEWDKSLHNWHQLQAQFELNNSCDIIIREVPNKPSYDNMLAWANGYGGNRIYLIKGKYEWATKIITMHELGHAFGAHHVNGTLMNSYPTYLIKDCPDFTTILQVAVFNNIEVSQLSFCY